MAGSYSPVGGGYNIAYAVQVQDLYSKPLDDFAKKMSNVERQVGNASQKIEQKLNFSQMAKGIETFGRNMSLYVSAPLSAFAGFSLKAAANVQMVQRSMQAFAGDPAIGEALFQKIDDMSNKSIIGLKEYADTARVLMGSGIANTDTVIASLKDFADVSTVFQIPMSELSEQAAAAEQFGFSTRQAKSLAMSGIPVFKEMQKYLKTNTGVTYSEAKIKELISKGRISGHAYMAIIKQLTAPGAKAFNGMENGAQGLTQSFALLRNSAGKFSEQFGESMDKVFDISGNMKAASEHVNKFTQYFKDFSEMNPGVMKNIAALGSILIGLPPILAAVTWAVRAMSASMMLNPVILAITALAAALALLVANWEKVKSAVTSPWTAGGGLYKVGADKASAVNELFASERNIMTQSLQSNSNLQVDLNVKDPKGYVESVQSKNDGINKFNLGMNGVAAMPAY